MVGAGRHGVQAAPGDPGRAAAPLGLGPVTGCCWRCSRPGTR